MAGGYTTREAAYTTREAAYTTREAAYTTREAAYTRDQLVQFVQILEKDTIDELCGRERKKSKDKLRMQEALLEVSRGSIEDLLICAHLMIDYWKVYDYIGDAFITEGRYDLARTFYLLSCKKNGPLEVYDKLVSILRNQRCTFSWETSIAPNQSHIRR